MRSFALAWMFAAGAALPAFAQAAGAVAGDIVGEWDCGETRLVITRLGSIEVIGTGDYRAGLFEADGARLDVAWDAGGQSRLRVTRRSDGLTVSGLGAPLECVARR
ncbi:hypothetical protein H0I76_18935 [Limibaculum sp. M0105]|uniref:C-type lysozyme inhibitor domain-containing protein n=1 Tax=Thermohalobaculum xanthum TaxID=2753746 RepID=A0A8J7SGV6_9RHOB|nr:hypothetical protein [Thermohalobaculum xanthum]MBK0401278.1 hypothetical protein [Thermohalobaculum xanthum]